MPSGIASATKVFQKKMIEAFEGIHGVEIIYDDVLATGRTIKEYDNTLRQVLQPVRKRNVKFNKEKLKICIPVVKYICG